MLSQVVNFETNWKGKNVIQKWPKLSKRSEFNQESGILDRVDHSQLPIQENIRRKKIPSSF